MKRPELPWVFWGDGMFYILIVLVAHMCVDMVKTQQTTHLKSVPFMEYKLHRNIVDYKIYKAVLLKGNGHHFQMLQKDREKGNSERKGHCICQLG